MDIRLSLRCRTALRCGTQRTTYGLYFFLRAAAFACALSSHVTGARAASTLRVSTFNVPPAATAPDNGLVKTPLFRHFGVADGMPSSSVHALLEDRDGFIWFATVDGLARYDGIEFRIYRHESAHPESLGGNDVTAIFVDSENRIWCALESAGLDMLDIKRESFTHFRHDAGDVGSLNGDDVWTLAQDANGAILAGTGGGGLDTLDAGTKTFSHTHHDAKAASSLGSDKIEALLADRAGQLWIGTDYGLDRRRVDAQTRNVRFEHVDFSAVLTDGGRLNVRKLLEESGGSILAATNRGLLRIDENLKASVIVSGELTHRAVFAMAFDDDGELWIGTQRGLNRRDLRGNVSNYLANPYLSGSLAGNLVPDVLRDHEGNMWIASDDAGVMLLPATWRNFALYRHDPTDAHSLSASRAQSLSLDAHGALWVVNNEGGIDRVDPVGGDIEAFAPRLASLPTKALLAVMADGDDRLWIGHASGARIYHLAQGTFEDLPVSNTRSDALTAGGIGAFARDGAANIWAVSTGRALHRIDAVNHGITRFVVSDAGLRSVDINQIATLADGTLWIASASGLDRFEAATQRFVAVPGAPDAMVIQFALAPDGSVWLLEEGVLEHFRDDHGSLVPIARFGAAEGWQSATYTGMQIDAQGLVWVSGARGLWRYDWHARALRRFGEQDGLPSAEFNDAQMVQRADGTMFAASLNGIVGFSPQRMLENELPPRLVLDSLSVRRRVGDVRLDLTAAQAALPTLQLRWNDRDLRVAARALSFANAQGNRYQWRLQDFDRDWIDTANRGYREFSQLPTGRHTLQVRAANASGIWSQTTQIVLQQAPPPWATAAAYVFYVIAITLLGWLVFMSYRKRLERRHALELAEQHALFAQRSNAAKSTFLATLGHEIRTPMTGVLGMTELLLRSTLDTRQRGYVDAIQTSGEMLLRLVNDSLDLARIEAGKLALLDTPLDLHLLIGEVAQLAQAFAQSRGLKFVQFIAADAPRWVRGDAVRLKQIFLNLINNAIKFTDHGDVRIALTRSAEGAAQVAVQDTGPGISDSARIRLFHRFEQGQEAQARHGGSGLGLSICRELVALMHGEIALETVLGSGSTFTVTLPLEEMGAEPRANGLPLTLRDASAAPTRDGTFDASGVQLTALHAEQAIWTHSTEADATARIQNTHHHHSAANILLVEDDAIAAAVIEGLILLLGYRVISVAHGLAALAELDTQRFDMALVDIDLPGIDGFTLARMIRKREGQESRERLPLICISARSHGDEEAAACAAGMDAFVRKPLTAAMLDASIERARVTTLLRQ